MALNLQWYDFVCFGTVGGTMLISLWVLWRKEGGKQPDDNTIYVSLIAGRPESYGYEGKGNLNSAQLWLSCWRGVHPIWLLCLRFVSFAVMIVFLVFDVLEWKPTIFLYYTEWTFSLVIVYFGLGTIVSAYGCFEYSNKPSRYREGRDSLYSNLEESRLSGTVFYGHKDHKSPVSLQPEIQQRAGFWGFLMQVIYQTCGGAVILTDIVFWCIIVPFSSNGHLGLGLDLLMGFMHSVNAFFLLLDASVNSLQYPWFRLSYFLLWSCIYIIFQWVIHACGFSWWPYPFLELSSAWAPLWYVLLALVHIPCYGLYALLVRAKISIFSRLFPRAFLCT